MAHCVHLSDEAVGRFAATGTGVAHCPTSNGRLGSGIAPVRDLLGGRRAGRPRRRRLGVQRVRPDDRRAAPGAAGRPVPRTGRWRCPPAQSLQMATMGGARCLGRDDELGSLEPGKLADVALWRVDGLAGAGIADPVCTLVFGAPGPGPPVRRRPPGRDRRGAGDRRRRRAWRPRPPPASAADRASARPGREPDRGPARHHRGGATPGSAAWRAGDAWLAGGTWLFSEPQPALTRLLDLQRVRLAGAAGEPGRPGDRRHLHAGRAGPAAGPAAGGPPR